MYYLSPDNSLVKQVSNFVNLTNINKARFKFMFDFMFMIIILLDLKEL